jgi:hypothetical protein
MQSKDGHLRFNQKGLSRTVTIVLVASLLLVLGIVAVVAWRGAVQTREAVPVPSGNAGANQATEEEVPAGDEPQAEIEGLNVRRKLTDSEAAAYGFPEGSEVYGTLKLDDAGAQYMDFEVVNAPPDTDRDGLTDTEEKELGTDPDKADTDGDGLSDRTEKSLGTNPLRADTDGDGYSDGEEVEIKRDPNDYSG